MSQYINTPANDQAVRTISHGQVSAQAVTPSDTVNFSKATRALYIGGAGNIAVVMADGTTVTFNNPALGVVHLLSVLRVNATNTTATNIVALF